MKMKRISLLILSLLFFATAFQSDKLLTSGWVQQTIPRQDLFVADLQFVDTLTGFMVQSRYSPDTSFISKTTDGGNNWIVTQFVNYYLTSLHFFDKNIGYCVGGIINTNDNGIVLKSTNGGNNWFTVSLVSSFIKLDDVMFVNKDTGWVCSTDLISGGLWRTINGGQTWQLQLNDSYRPSKIFFVNNNTGWVIGNSGQYLYKTNNCGVNWFALPNLGNNLGDVFFATIDTGYVTGCGGNGMMRTTDGGTNWYPVNTPVIIQGTRLFFVNSQIGWAGSRPYKIFATNDGFNWGTQYSPNFTSYNVSFVDSLHGWAGYSGLAHTVDGGGTITYIGIKQNGSFIPSFELGQNYPNPFNASTRIKFSILKSCYLDLKIYNIKGVEVAKPISGLGYKPGEYEFYFDAEKYSISSGVYFYLMKGATTDNKEIFIDTKKMLMIK